MKAYPLSAFDSIPTTKATLVAGVSLDELPSIDEVEKLASWTEEMVERFSRDGDFFAIQPDGTKEDRSAAMAAFTYLAAEKGWSDEQLMVALLDIDERWGKYKGRRDQQKRLLDFISRARQKIGYNPVTDIDLSHLLRQPDPSVVDESGNGALVYGAQDFIDTEFHIEWMLDGLLPVGGFGLIVGTPGVGKTQFGIQLSSYLALGLDRFLRWEGTLGAKKTLFLSMEMGKAPLNHFMSQIANTYEDRALWNKNFLVAPFGTPIPIDTKEGQAFINTLMDEHMPDVLLIDSLQRSISKEMNDELSMKSLIHYLAVLRDKYKCAVVMIHHNRKKPNDNARKELDLDDMYGSRILSADADFVLGLVKLNPNLIGVSTLKNRLGPELESFEAARDSNLHFTVASEEMVNGLMTTLDKKGVGI